MQPAGKTTRASCNQFTIISISTSPWKKIQERQGLRMRGSCADDATTIVNAPPPPSSRQRDSFVPLVFISCALILQSISVFSVACCCLFFLPQAASAKKPAAAAAKPAAAAAPARVPPGKNEGAKLRTTAGQTKSPPIMKVGVCVCVCCVCLCGIVRSSSLGLASVHLIRVCYNYSCT